MKKLLVFLGCLIGSVNSWAAGGLDLALSSEAASLYVLFHPGGHPRAGGTTEISLGAVTNELGDNVYNGTFFARGVGYSSRGQYNIGAGVRLVGGELDNDNIAEDKSVSALALGFQAAILLVPSAYNPVDLIVEGFYAPSISSFDDAEEYTEASARLQIDIVPQARAFIGYRRMAFEIENAINMTIDKSAHIGLSIRF